MNTADKDAIDTTVDNVLGDVLNDINNGNIPQIALGDNLTNVGGSSREKKRAALKALLANLFSAFPGMREIKLSKTEMGLPDAMLNSFSGLVKVVKPDPNIINSLPNLSQESFYCNLEVGEVTKIDFQGVPYFYTKNNRCRSFSANSK